MKEPNLIFRGRIGSYSNSEIQNRVDLSEMEELLFKNGVFQLVSVKDLSLFSREHIVQFGHTHAMYVIPTIELVESLKDLIGGDHAVEVGSGCGVLGKALGIKCTDNFQQTLPEIAFYYKQYAQPTIKYGTHVEKRDAEWVAKKWRPDVILASWLTHKYCEELKSGNAYGPDEEILLDNCKRYIVLGNSEIHAEKPIMKYKPDIIHNFPGYITRSVLPNYNCVYIWKGRK